MNTQATHTPALSLTQRHALRCAERDGVLCEPELYLDCDAGGLTIYNIRRAVETLKRAGYLATDSYGDTIITDKGRAAIARATGGAA